MLLEILILINLARSQPLIPDADLFNRAQARAEQLYRDNQWSHDGYKQSFDNTDCSYQGENLARNFANGTDAFVSLYNSPKHRANIMNINYTHIGIGKYENVIVQLFCGIL